LAILFGVVLPLEGNVFGATTGGWRQEVERCTSHCVDDGEFSGVWQWDLEDGRVLLDMHRTVAFSGAVVAST
jgi:hypothetical protein